MFGLNNSSGIPVMPAIAEALTSNPQWFTEGGNGVSPSYPGADWFNAVQGELLSVLYHSGKTPSTESLTQLLESIQSIAAEKVSSLKDEDGATNVCLKLNKSTAIIRTVYQVLAEYVSVTEWGAKCDFNLDTKTGTDDTDAINNCLSECAGYKVLLPGLSLISADVNIPSYTMFEGASKACGLAMSAVPESHVSLLKMDGYKSHVKNMTLYYTAPTDCTLQTVDTLGIYGVEFSDSSIDCTAEEVLVDAKTISGVMGWSFAYRLSGNKNKLLHCDSNYATVGIHGGGTAHKVIHGVHSNHYYEQYGNSAWTSSNPCWDGVMFEGLVDSDIIGLTCDDNGQSGIYCGGNGSLSYGNLFQGNKTRLNWNRGIDMGVSGVVDTESNAVMFNRYICNESIDNRESQLWYYNNIGSLSLGNRAYITSAYAARYLGNEGGKVGLVLTGDSSSDNTAYGDDIVVDSTSSACVTLDGVNNKIQVNARGGYNRIYSPGGVSTIVNNEVDRYDASWTASIVTGSGVTLSSNTCKIHVSGKTLKFQMNLTFGASSPSGTLVLGYIPGMSGRTIRESNVSVNYISGFNSSMSSSQIKAYISNSDQIQIIRQNYTWNFDVASYLVSGATMQISGEIEFM